MLLELAIELDAEAAAIEARGDADHPRSFRLQPPDAYHMMLHMTATEAEARTAADHQPHLTPLEFDRTNPTIAAAPLRQPG